MSPFDYGDLDAPFAGPESPDEDAIVVAGEGLEALLAGIAEEQRAEVERARSRARRRSTPAPGPGYLRRLAEAGDEVLRARRGGG